MGSPLKILIIEDSPQDSALLLNHLQAGGFDPQYEIVQTAISLRRALSERKWDVVVSDHSLPGFDVFGALSIFREAAVDIPFIILSGSIRHEQAVAAMKAGAHDYLLKDNLSRLIPAIRRELEEAANRESRRVAERELARVKEKLAQQLLDMTCLHQLSVRLSTAPDLDSVMREILAAVTSLENSDSGALLLFDQNQKRLAVAATLRLECPEPTSYPVPDHGISQRAVIECRAIEADTETAAHELIFAGQAKAAGCRIGRSVPLVTRGGALIGCLETYLREDAAPQVEEKRLIELYIGQAGQVLDNMILYKQTEDASRLKDEFVAMVSHELRTPLTPILGAVHMLKTNPGDTGLAVRACEIVERNARAQAQIIQDLLDVSSIIAGKLLLNLSEVDVDLIVNEAIATVRPAAEAKEIAIEATFDPNGRFIVADPDRLRQIVWNLLSNAVKFTPKAGRIKVEINAPEDSVEIVVSDNGIGIAGEFLPFVFERFRQVDSSSTRAHGGLGLGLAIVRQLVELQGGTVHVDSAGPGRGSAFRINLPIRKSVDQRRAV